MRVEAGERTFDFRPEQGGNKGIGADRVVGGIVDRVAGREPRELHEVVDKGDGTRPPPLTVLKVESVLTTVGTWPLVPDSRAIANASASVM